MAGRSFIAEHVREIGSSGIRRVFDLAATMENPINFSIGQPDFPVPRPVKDAMIRAIDLDHNGYTVTRGLPELRAKIAASLQREFGEELDVCVTSAVSGGLLCTLLACLDPGDEVLIGDPSFVSYRHLTRMARGTPVLVSLYDDLQLHPERFAAAVTRKSKCILVGSPGNPTGVTYRREDMAALAKMAQERDLLVISDEIYHDLTYDGPAASPVEFAPERTVLLRGFGKSHAMTGLRIGFAAGPPEIISEIAKLQQYTFVCAPHPVQYGAMAALDTDVSDHVAAYRGKRDLVCEELSGSYEFMRPTGGFYVFPKVPARYASATEFTQAAIQRKVLIIPGEVFGERDTHFRISYAVPDAKIREGCAILRELARPL